MSRRRRSGGGLQFFAWAVIGAGAVAGVLTVLTIGFFVLLATAGLAALLARRAGGPLAWPGIIAGAGLPALYVGYLNRGGPGTVCAAIRGGQSCIQEMSPWPWVAVGVCAAAAGAGLYLLLRRRLAVNGTRTTGQRPPAGHE
jgi:hypothetical protein